MKRWRRTLLTCALLLLAGAVVNLAVAWGIRATSSLDGLRQEFVAPPWHVPLDTYASAAPPGSIRGAPSVTRTESYEYGAGLALSVESRSDFGACFAVALGWPWRGLVMFTLVHSAGAVEVERGVLHLGFAQTSNWNLSYFDGDYPVELLFPGFLLDTIFYATILALPLSLVPLRQRLRARRGRCPKCNYDLAGLDGPCPECGAAR